MNKLPLARLYSQTKLFHSRMDCSFELIRKALLECDSWYIALSGGKDSTVVYHLVRSILPEIAALYVDEEWLLPETEEYLQRFSQLYSLHRIRKRDEHAEWFTAWEGDAEAWTGKNVTGRYAHSQGWDGAFIGLRAEENNRRKMHLRTGGRLFFNQGRQIWQCNPIHNWTWQDVWAYIVSNDLDYNHAYDRLDEIGIEPERQRIGPLAQRRVLGYGQLQILKRGWPELFNKFAAEFPEARLYV